MLVKQGRSDRIFVPPDTFFFADLQKRRGMGAMGGLKHRGTSIIAISKESHSPVDKILHEQTQYM